MEQAANPVASLTFGQVLALSFKFWISTLIVAAVLSPVLFVASVFLFVAANP